MAVVTSSGKAGAGNGGEWVVVVGSSNIYKEQMASECLGVVASDV